MSSKSHTPSSITHGLSRLLAAARVPMMVGIVMIHCDYLILCGDDAAAITPAASAIIRFLSQGLPMVCVPFFFFLSGMLFFNRLTPTTLWPKLRRRGRSLVVPYVIWCSVGLAVFAVKLTPAMAGMFPAYAHLRFTWIDALKGYWVFDMITPDSIGPYDYVMWFVRDLIVVLALSPVLMWIVREWRILIVVGGYLAAHYCHVDDSLGMGTAILFFALGGWAIGLGGEVLEGVVSRGWWALPIYITYAVYHTVVGVGWLEAEPVWIVMMIAGIVGVLWGTRQVCARYGLSPGGFVGESLFFVFAFHGIFAYVATKQVVRLLDPTTTIGALGCYTGLVALHWLVALGVFWTLRRYFPRLTSVVTGGRSVA